MERDNQDREIVRRNHSTSVWRASGHLKVEERVRETCINYQLSGNNYGVLDRNT